jgi:hypothetical protein
MIINTQLWLDECASKFLGKTVFFLNYNCPCKGVVSGYDNLQLFVGNNHSLIYGKSEFFFFNRRIVSVD